jgi:hypothetical protein
MHEAEHRRHRRPEPDGAFDPAESPPLDDRREQPLLHRSPQRLRRRRERLVEEVCEQAELEAVADAGGGADRLLGLPRQLRDHLGEQIDDVGHDLRLFDAREVPAPSGLLPVKDQEPGSIQISEEMAHEERIARRLPPDDRGQLGHVGGLGAQRVTQERHQRIGVERAQRDACDRRAAGSNRLQRSAHGMVGIELIAAARAQDQKRADLRIDRHRAEQLQRRRVDPLQIVEEQHERRTFGGERAHEGREHQLKTVFIFRRADLGHRRLIAEERAQIGNRIDQHAAIRRYRLLNALREGGL